MLAQLCCRRHLARAESAALACHAAAILLFATMPSFLSMSAWRTFLAGGCIALLVLHDWPCLALRPASRPSAVSPRIAAADSPSPPPSPRDDGQTCGSCKRDFDSHRGFAIHTSAGTLLASWHILYACGLGRRLGRGLSHAPLPWLGRRLGRRLGLPPAGQPAGQPAGARLTQYVCSFVCPDHASCLLQLFASFCESASFRVTYV